MDKNKITAKVQQKLLDEKIKKELGDIVQEIKEESPESISPIIINFKKVNNLDDEQYAKILEILISAHKLHSINPEYKKELKKITDNPPVKIYFDLLY